MQGYEMTQEIERRSLGTWRPSPGSVYPALQLPEDEVLIAGQAAEGGRRRYHLTEPGRAAGCGGDTARARWERFTDEYGESVLDTRAAVHGAGEVVRAGSEQRRERAIEVLDRARPELYRILADRD